MNKRLLSYILFIVTTLSFWGFTPKSYAQTTASFAYLSGGVTENANPYTASSAVVYGFSVTVGGTGSINFSKYYIGSYNNATNAFANATLMRCSTNNYGTGTHTPVGSVTMSTGTGDQAITINNLSETIAAGNTNYYFIVVDVIGTSYTGCQLYSNNSQIATDNAGTNYLSGFNKGVFNNFSASTTIPLRITPESTNLANPSTILTAGTNDVAVFGFSITGAGTYNVSQININSNVTLSQYFSTTGYTLYTTGTSSSYSTGSRSPVTATITPSGSSIGIAITGTNLQTTTSPQYYWLVVNMAATYTGTIPANTQFNITSGQTSPGPAFTSSGGNCNTATIFGPTYTLNYASVSITSAQNNLSGTTITTGQADIAMFGFGISASSNITVPEINVSNDNANLDIYFNNGKVYTCSTGSTYSSTSRNQVGTVAFSGSNAKITFTTAQTIGTSPTYYFLAADNIAGASPTQTVKFKFANGQTNNAVVESSPHAATFNNFTISNGNTYTLPAPTVNYSVSTTGYTPVTTITVGQRSVLYGVTVSATGNISIPSPQLNFTTNNNPTGFFPTLELWVSTTGSYATATQVSGVTFGNIGGGLKAGLPSTLNLTAGTSYTYYLVGTLASNSGLPTSWPITSLGVYGNGGGSSTYATSSLSTTTYNLVTATVSITGNNGSGVGITQGSLSPGQTGIVLFGFKMVAQGAFTMSKLTIPYVSGTGANMGAYFTSGKLYRSTSPNFSSAAPVSGTIAVNFGSVGYVQITGLTETFTASAPTTYYYFLVADLTAGNNMVATTVQFNFTSSQSPIAINTGSGSGDTFNGFTTTDGVNFSIVNIYIWTGSTSTDFNDYHNFTDIKGNAVSLPNSSITVTIGVNSYTRQPNVTGNITVGGLTFGTATSAAMTIASTKTLTIATGINAINGTSASISGPSSSGVIISNTATSALTAGSTLTLDGGMAVSNAGIFTVSPTSKFNLTNNATFNNTGTFNLSSDATGSATVGQIIGTSVMTGNYNVERFIQGSSDLSKRGYRLLSSPVYAATVTSGSSPAAPYTAKVYDLSYLSTQSVTTGLNDTGNGFTIASPTHNPSLYLFREDIASNSSSFTSGNFKGITKLNNTPAYSLGITAKATTTNTNDSQTYLPIGNGFLFYFRGNNTANQTAKITAPSYAAPENTVLVQTGSLNQGSIIVQPWFTTNTNLSFSTVSTGNTNASIKGYNLVGNPYASTINLETFGTSAASGIAIPNGIGTKIYQYNSTSKQYKAYQPAVLNGGTATSEDGVVSNLIAPGQGFFVVATAANQTITFNEAAKVSTQNAAASVIQLMGIPVAAVEKPDPMLRIKMIMDTINTDAVCFVLNKTYDPKYTEAEDAIDLGGNGALISLTAFSSDGIGLGINRTPLPKRTPTILQLGVDATASGTYSLKNDEIKNLPSVYKVTLRDKFKNDSLDLRTGNAYSFTIDKGNGATFGNNRFEVVIREDYQYKFLTLAAAKDPKGVLLNWKTQSEYNYLTFTVERSIDGGKTYNPIGSVQSDSTGTYNFLDKNVTTGIYLYRIKQDDVNNDISYSQAVTITYYVESKTLVSIYPIPTSSNVSISVASTTSTAIPSYTIRIVSSTGNLVKELVSTQSVWQGNVSDLLPGIYIVQVLDNNNSKSVVGRSKFTKI